MRKIPLLLSAAILLIAACNKSSRNDDASSIPEEDGFTATERKCGADEILQEQLKTDAALRERRDQIEAFTQRYIQNPDLQKLVNGKIQIPVVVNILYKTSAENISAAQIQSQINVLNKDFSATNSDYNKTSTYSSVKSGDIGIEFVLDQVITKSTTKRNWQLNDAMKKNSQDGISPTSPTTKLNVWVCNLSSGYLGYAQFPGGSSATDGIVIDNNAFGTTGSATAPFDLGRTATHEVGHWMNLRHIWGDATCGNDQVGDTPVHNTANYGCPAAGHRSTCSGTPIEMTMNYMDYTDDACMYMFSAGQKTRMLAVFASGGPRNSFAQP